MDITTAVAQAREARQAVIEEARAEGLAEALERSGYVAAEGMRRYLEALRTAKAYVPKVGDGMTIEYPQDRYPLMVTRVSPSGKTAWVKSVRTVDRSTGHEPDRFDGPFPIWDHTYTAEELAELVNEAAPEMMVRRSRDGLSWSLNGTHVSSGGATFKRNYSY